MKKLHRRILRTAIWTATLLLLVKGIAAVREIAIASRFGTSSAVDTYFIVSSLAFWPVSVWMASCAVVGVPFFVTLGTEGHGKLTRAVVDLALASVVVGIALAIAFMAIVPAVAPSLLADAAFADEIVVALALSLPFGFLSGLLSARLLADERRVVTLLEGMPPIVATLGIVVVGSIGSVAWGTTIGFALQATVLFLLFRQSANGKRSIADPSSAIGTFAKVFVPVFLLQLVVGVTGLVDQVMVAWLGAGAIATLGYASRILALVMGLSATAVARAALPVFSELSSNEGRLSVLVRSWVLIMFGLGIAIVAVGWLLAPFAVELLFERGAFSEKDTARVAAVLQVGLLQLPFFLASIVAVQALAARGNFRTINRIGLANVAIKCIANPPLIFWLGVEGTMVSSAIMYAATLGYALRAAFGNGKRAGRHEDIRTDLLA